MHLKYIKLVILKILFILGLSNFKFSRKIPLPSPPTSPQQNYSPLKNTTTTTKIKASDLSVPLSKYFSRIFNSPPPRKKKVEGGACHVFSGYRNGTLVENGLEEMVEWDTLKKWLYVCISPLDLSVKNENWRIKLSDLLNYTPLE